MQGFVQCRFRAKFGFQAFAAGTDGGVESNP